MKYVIIALVAAAVGLAVGFGSVAMEFSVGGDHFRYANQHLPEVDDSGQAVETVEIADTGAVPRVKIIGESEVDVGSIEQFTEGTEVFKIANEGEAPLELELEGTTCKCTVGKLETNIVQPGQVAEIELKYKAESMTLRYRHGATIRTNDPRSPKLQLNVSGVVERRLYPMPDQVVFTRISSNTSSQQSVAVFTIRLPDFEIKEITFDDEATAEFFECEFTKLTEDEVKAERGADGGMKLTLRTKPGLANGPFRQTMRIRSNRSNDMLVPISGTVIADVTIVGGKRYNIDTGVFGIGIVDKEKGASAKMYVLVKGPNRENVDVKIESVSPADILKAELGPPVAKGKVIHRELTVSVPKGSTPANYLGSQDRGYGSVILSTTDPRNKRIKVRIYFAVQ